MTNLEYFDMQLQSLVNTERQRDYGHPYDHFIISGQIKKTLQACPDLRMRHVLEMIADKMARLCHSPDHLDSWIDIAGYARTAVMCMDEAQKRELEATANGG